MNKTDSAVRITHIPSGIVVQCQNERSQTSNKQTALRILRSRLAELEEEKREAELARERGAAQDIGFGSQIRSYVLHPYQLVKDHRTDHEVGNIQSVLDGALDGFVHSYLLAKAAGKVLYPGGAFGSSRDRIRASGFRSAPAMSATIGASREPERPSAAASPLDPVLDYDSQTDTTMTALAEPQTEIFETSVPSMPSRTARR